MSGSQRRHGDQDEQAAQDHRHPVAAGAERDPTAGVPMTRAADPRLASTGAAAPGLLALQRTAGNAAVASLVGGIPAVQRAVEIEEMTSQVNVGDTAANAGAAGAAAGAGAAGAGAAGSGPVTSDGANTTITGGQVTIDAPMTQANGVIRATTVIADSIVASSYTPGAGNVW